MNSSLFRFLMKDENKEKIEVRKMKETTIEAQVKEQRMYEEQKRLRKFTEKKTKE